MVLAFGIALTSFAWRQQRQILDARMAVQFDNEIERTRTSILSNVAFYEDVLWNIRSVFAAELPITYDEWERYASTLAVQQTYPGIEGVGFIKTVPPADLAEFVKHVQADGMPDYKVSPPSLDHNYYAVRYAYPMPQSMPALSIDLSTIHDLHNALHLAQESGDPSISGRVDLSDWRINADGRKYNPTNMSLNGMVSTHQSMVEHGAEMGMLAHSAETDSRSHGNMGAYDLSSAGFFIFQPLYHTNMPLTTIDERKAALIGWVYALVNSRDMMDSIIGLDTSLIHFEIFDGVFAGPNTVLFNHATGNHSLDIVEDEKEVQIEVSGRSWTLKFAKLPAFSQASSNRLPESTLISGLLITLLLFGIFQFIARDVVKRRETALQIGKSEEKFSNLFHHSNDAIFMHDFQGRIMDVNQRASIYFGRIRSELLALRIHDLFPATELTVAEPLLEKIAEQGSVSFETTLRKQDGRLFAAELSASTFKLNGVNVVQTMVRDITKRTIAQRALETERRSLAQRVTHRTAALQKVNEELTHASLAKDEFLATMSHELRTPLAAILGQTELLTSSVYGNLNDKQRHAASTVQESGQHLLSLISDILALSKADAGSVTLKIEPIQVEKICNTSLRFVAQAAQKKGVHIQFTNRQANGVIYSDPRRLKQILINLLENAIKFTETGGRVGLVVVANADSDTVYFVVWDTGIGIAKQDQTRLFDPFVQLDSRLAREHDGAGLGLALVARFAKLLGGRVALESELGKGSRFVVSLPTKWQGSAEDEGEISAEIKTIIS